MIKRHLMALFGLSQPEADLEREEQFRQRFQQMREEVHAINNDATRIHAHVSRTLRLADEALRLTGGSRHEGN